MFLSPQHFQQQERYVEHFTREFVGQISPNSYGLTHLELDRTMLSIGKVSVRRAKGIFLTGHRLKSNRHLLSMCLKTPAIKSVSRFTSFKTGDH